MGHSLIIIRGSPASGKSSLARNLTKKLNGKIALLTVDEFRWIMTAHENRDKRDYAISFDNFLYALESYLKSGYNIVVEDTWVRKNKDEATDINKVIHLGKKYNTKIHQILLRGSWNTIKHLNTLRPMILPQKELKEIYDKVYSKSFTNERIINIDGKKPQQILKEVLKLL